MSGIIVSNDSKQLSARKCFALPCLSAGSAGRVALLTAFFAALSVTTVHAGALDWLNSSSRSGKGRTAKVETSNQVQLQTGDYEEQKLTGNNLDSYQFAQTHFSHSRNRMEKACRAISSRHNDAAARDILQKLFVIDTQFFKENIKNSALAVKEILRVNDTLAQGLQDLTRVVTAPGQETLDSLEKSVDQTGAANLSQVLLVKKYLAGAEKTIEIAQAAYETLELIPSLSITGLDLMVQMSKQLMRMTQSNGEAFKGLLLNVQSSGEQVAAGLENIKKTVRETLRFSDHFAIKQFPLINLPAPSREKIFVQLNSLANSVKGVENTVTIGDSQVRNTAQQFTHLVSGFLDKAAESLKYQSPEGGEKALEQISTYARNQVSGLFLRVKEDISQMRTDMARASRPSAGNVPPAVNFESRDEFAARKARSASEQRLPLFLLGGAGQPAAAVAPTAAPTEDESLAAPPANEFIALNTNARQRRPAPVKSGATQVLYNEKEFAVDESELLQPEMNILTKELGSDFFFADKSENLSEGSVMAQSGDMPSYGDDDVLPDEAGFADDKSGDMQMSYSNLNDSGEPEIELLKLDTASGGNDSEDLIPMMRYDSDVLNLEE